MIGSTLSTPIHAIEYEQNSQKLIANPMIRMIAACARNRVMGINGTLPWKIERDWEHFLETTRDGVMIMGRRCYEDFVEHARNRKVIALSRNPNHHFAYAQRADCLSGALEMASSMGKNTWICGGEEIYREAMPLCEELHLTQIDASFEGDAFFPSWEEHFPNEVSRREMNFDGYPLAFLVFKK